MIEIVKDLRALPGLVARLIDAIESIADAIDDVLHRANVEQREREQAQAATLEETRAVCPLCLREWRAVSPVRVAMLEWQHGNCCEFVIAVTHGNAQHIVHRSTHGRCGDVIDDDDDDDNAHEPSHTRLVLRNLKAHVKAGEVCPHERDALSRPIGTHYQAQCLGLLCPRTWAV